VPKTNGSYGSGSGTLVLTPNLQLLLATKTIIKAEKISTIKTRLVQKIACF
jgi:hypothetical protein